MKYIVDSRRTLALVKIFVLALSSIAFFYVGKRWSDNTESSFLFFGPGSTSRHTSSPSVGISPNANKIFDVSSLIHAVPTPPSRPGYPPPPPPVTGEKVGILDENGTMSDNFEVEEFDPDLVEKWSEGNMTREVSGEGEERATIGRFRLCPEGMQDYIPCLDNEESIAKLNSTERGEKYERHCPGEGKGLNCLVPAPKDYKPPIPWPRSREEVWFSNVPHKRLVDDKGGQNWIKQENDKFIFPGGGTQFIHGADQYLNQISEMIPEIAFGKRTRIVLDVGCGVASFGAFLLSRNVTTLSIAPKDVHENQIQFALERGVPAMVAAFATHRLLYPSQAFDLIHCSRCRINWTRDDGMLLLEVNRMLRAGGYFAWAAQPVYKHEEAQQEAWIEMEDLTSRICWELVKKEGYIALWRKPLNNSCYINRDVGVKPPLCDIEDNPDSVWFAAALMDQQLDCWVMNVVPTSEPNTLPVIYDRGLIGVAHDWCEPFDTYPRTYDLLHAASLFSKEKKRCNITNILLEMDRMLRPGGRAYIQDSASIVDEIKEITRAMGWKTDLHDTSEGPYGNTKVLMCEKQLLRL